MEQPIAVFEPIRSGNYNIVMISLLSAVIAAAFLIYNLKKDVSYKQKGYKQLFSLLAFFVVIIATTTAFFSYWAALKFKPVKVYSQAIETSFGKVALKDIQNIYILNDQQLAPLSGTPKGPVTRFLIVEEVDRKTHALSEENYNIDSLIIVLNTLKK